MHACRVEDVPVRVEGHEVNVDLCVDLRIAAFETRLACNRRMLDFWGQKFGIGEDVEMSA